MQFILKTKLHKPQPTQKSIGRPGLMNKLNSGLTKKLTLIIAPAGYGKSTLVSQWVGTRQNAVWFSIDEADNDKNRFLNYFLATIQQFNEELTKPAMQVLESQSQKPSIEYVLGELINQLAILEKQLIIVLDDYHLIKNKEIHDLLAFFIANMPPNIHLVMATRSDPPLMLARLRGQAQITELRAGDLCFSKEEATSFFKEVMQLDIDNEGIEKLDKRIEGWITGMQMAGITMQSKKNLKTFIDSLSANNQYIVDYLSEEIYQQQPENIKNFLLQTSVLERFNTALCNHVTELDNSEDALEYLRKSNLFIIPLDDEREWFRYHHLFGDLLLQRLHKYLPNKVQELHWQAGKWFEMEGFKPEAIEHLIKAKEFEHAEQLISIDAESYWVKGEQAMLQKWTNLFPESYIFKPGICIVLAATNILDGNYTEAERIAENAQSAPEAASNDQIRGMVAAVKAYIANYQGKIAETEKHGKEALAILDDKNALWKCLAGLALGDVYVQKGPLKPATDCYLESLRVGKFVGYNYCNTLVQHRVVVMYHRRGKLQEGMKLLEQFFENETKNKSVSGALYMVYGELLYEFNKLDEAEKEFSKTLEICEKQLHIAALPYCSMMLAKVYLAQGDAEKAIQTTNNSLKLLKKYDMPPWVVSFTLSWKAQLDILQGDLETANKHFISKNLHPNGDFNYSNLTDYVVFAQYLVVKQEFEHATVLLERLVDRLITIEWMELALKAKISQAYVFNKTNEKDKAIEVIKEVLNFAQPEGYIRTIIDYWEFAEELLGEIKKEEKYNAYIEKLYSIVKHKVTKIKEENIPDLVEPLSERELDVLKLFQTQITNTEIADKLYISVNTVKTHIKNIYFKLNTNNRSEAIDKALALGLI